MTRKRWLFFVAGLLFLLGLCAAWMQFHRAAPTQENTQPALVVVDSISRQFLLEAPTRKPNLGFKPVRNQQTTATTARRSSGATSFGKSRTLPFTSYDLVGTQALEPIQVERSNERIDPDARDRNV